MNAPAKIERNAKRITELETALANARQALLDGNWSLALGYTENALGIIGRKEAA